MFTRGIYRYGTFPLQNIGVLEGACPIAAENHLRPTGSRPPDSRCFSSRVESSRWCVYVYTCSNEDSSLSLDQILFYFEVEAFVHESIIRVTPCIAPLPPAFPAQLQYCCTSISQYTTPPRPTFCMPYTIHQTVLAMAISCKGQLVASRA